MLLLKCSAALLAAAMFQAPKEPPMKMGLWEITLHSSTKLPDGTSRDITHVLRTCTTRDNWLVKLGPTSVEACPKANEKWAADSYSFDVGRPGQTRVASISIHFDTPETQHGTIDLFVDSEGQPARSHSESTERWIGEACGDVSPDRPTFVR